MTFVTWPLPLFYFTFMTTVRNLLYKSGLAGILLSQRIGEKAMALGMLVSALILAQAAPAVANGDPAPESADTAYEQLAAGQTEEAIGHLETLLEEMPGDPSLLINLGTAYARAGRMEEARAAFRAAIAAEDRYRVQLADGSWEDSRKVARLALESRDRTGFAAR
jgi:tetratricopeptide (TPR) repeat protein